METLETWEYHGRSCEIRHDEKSGKFFAYVDGLEFEILGTNDKEFKNTVKNIVEWRIDSGNIKRKEDSSVWFILDRNA